MMRWSAACLSLSSLRRDSPRRANKDLDPKLDRICSPCWFLLLCSGEGEAEWLGRVRGVETALQGVTMASGGMRIVFG